MRVEKLVFLLFAAILISGTSSAINIDTPFLKRVQPDGKELWVREWGDEFQMNRETKEGYSCDYNTDTGYFCYTVRGEDGWLKLTPWKVGIDNPEAHSLSKHESISPGRSLEIQERRTAFARLAESNSQNLPGRSSAKVATPSEWEIDVVLIQFSDVKGDTTRYTKSDFENMLYGPDYVDSSDHPDGLDVFGSVKSYFGSVSNGHFTLSSLSGVLNSTHGNDIPNWITVGYTVKS